MSGEELFKSTAYVVIEGRRDAERRLCIGDEVLDQWPNSFEVAGIRFELTEEEDLDGGEVLGYYFQQGNAE